MKKINIAPNGDIYTDESDIQKAFIKFAKPYLRDDAILLFSIPNGSKVGGKLSRKGHPIGASIAIGEGLTKGVHDLFLSIPIQNYKGLYLECKTPIGEHSDEQKAFARKALEKGYAVEVFRSADVGMEIMVKYLNYQHIQRPLEEITAKPIARLKPKKLKTNG